MGPQVAVPPEVPDQAAAQFLVGGPACWSQALLWNVYDMVRLTMLQARPDHIRGRRSTQSPHGVCARVH